METVNDNSNSRSSGSNAQYILVVVVLIFIVPAIGFTVEHLVTDSPLTFDYIGKWFIFSAVGLRLFLAGVRQTTKPAFTAKEIFHIDSPDSLPIVRELGFTNLCFGLVGIISLVKPEWRIVSAFASGLYYGLAGLLHIIKKPVGINEWVALVTDSIVFLFLLIYFLNEI